MRRLWSWLALALLASNLSFVPTTFANEEELENLPEFIEHPTSPENAKDPLINRAFIIYDRSCRKCFEAAKLARAATERLAMDDERWENVFVYYDKREQRRNVMEFQRRFNNRADVGNLAIVFVDENSIERRFQIECSTPLDVWSMAWLYKGIDERPTPPTDERPLIRYPLTGGWWSVEGDWNPTREKVIKHLHESPNHDRKFELFWLELLTYEELQSVHTDHHLEMTYQGKVKWEYVNQQTPPGQTPNPPSPPTEGEEFVSFSAVAGF